LDLNKTQIEEALKAAQPEINRRIQETLIKELTDRLSWSASDILKKECELFIQKEIIPEVRKTLIDAKPQILEAMQAMAIEATQRIMQKLQAKINKNLEGH